MAPAVEVGQTLVSGSYEVSVLASSSLPPGCHTRRTICRILALVRVVGPTAQSLSPR